MSADPVGSGLHGLSILDRTREPVADDDDSIVVLDTGDVLVTIGDDEPEADDDDDQGQDDFYENLALKLDESDLSSIAWDLIEAIEEDDRSRGEWLEERAESLKWLGTKLPRSGTGGDRDAALSRSYHPLLLEAVLSAHATATGALLPSDGPVKVRDDMAADRGMVSSPIADALQRDMNHYLTVDAPEFVPDTDRMLLWTVAMGSTFKKVHRHPIWRRPVSESVDAADLIVSNDATDLVTAERVTQRVKMRHGQMRRLQIAGIYRDVPLDAPTVEHAKNAMDLAKEDMAGVTTGSTRPGNNPHVLYECYCLLDLPGYEHEEDGEPTGIPLPYRVTIETESRTILEVRRNWREDDETQRPIETYVHYCYVPMFGFYGTGLVSIAGNSSVAATALQRIMIDGGSFSNFPGFLYSDELGKQNTMDFSVPPGGGMPVKTGGRPIGDVVMPLPYKEPGPGINALYQSVVEEGKQVAGTAELQIGDGRQDAPVGTTLALLEQATKVMSAVHKRMLRAQGKELQLLKELFREHPEDFWRFNRKPAEQWTKEKLLAALNDSDFVPVSDPNTSSKTQRLMIAQAVWMMFMARPQSFSEHAVMSFVLSTLGAPMELAADGQQGQQGPDPKMVAATLKAQADMAKAENQAAELKFKAANAELDNQNKQADRETELRLAQMDIVQEMLINARKDAHESDLQERQTSADMAKMILQGAIDRNNNGIPDAVEGLS